MVLKFACCALPLLLPCCLPCVGTACLSSQSATRLTSVMPLPRPGLPALMTQPHASSGVGSQSMVSYAAKITPRTSHTCSLWATMNSYQHIEGSSKPLLVASLVGVHQASKDRSSRRAHAVRTEDLRALMLQHWNPMCTTKPSTSSACTDCGVALAGSLWSAG